jgi:hypothetical protein
MQASSRGVAPNGQHDTAGLLVGVNVPVSLDHVLERERSVDHRSIAASLDEFLKPGSTDEPSPTAC